MKILHVITSLRIGGAEKLMVDLLPRLKAQGLNVDLLLFDGTDTSFRRDVEAAGIKVFDLGIGGSVYSPAKLIKLIPFLKKYDVVHTHNTASQLFVAIGSIFSSVVLYTTEHTTSNRRRGWKWYAPIDRWMYSRYRKVICISKKTEDNLRNSLKKFPTETTTIYNGISIEKYSDANPSKELEKYSSDIIKVIMVAGFRHEKDHPSVIKAFKRMPDNFHLFLIGDGVRRKEYEDLIEELNLKNRIHLLGMRSDVPSLLKAADIGIMYSHWEGFGLAAVEVMAAGKPLIASDIPGISEVVKNAGILVPSESPTTIADEIQKLAFDKKYYAKVATACKLRALQFDISIMADGYRKLYSTSSI